MRKMERTNAVFIHNLVLIFVLTVVPEIVFSQGGATEIPENARARSYGNGWECGRGHREIDETCAAIEVPQNAYLDSTGYGWKCDT